MFWDKNKEEEESVSATTDSPEQAKNILGDESVESISNAIDEMTLIDPDEKRATTGARRGRKPKVLSPDNEPTAAEIVFGETLVETQAISISAVIKAFSTTDSTIEIYKLHMQAKKKLAYAFAKVAKEWGFEVTGKMAALAMLLTTEAGLIKDCWEVWEPKDENSEEEKD